MFPNLYSYPLLNLNPYMMPFYPEQFYYPVMPSEPVINNILVE